MDRYKYVTPPQGAILKDYSFFPTIYCLLASRKSFCGAHLPEEIQIKSYTALSWLGNAAKHIFIDKKKSNPA